MGATMTESATVRRINELLTTCKGTYCECDDLARLHCDALLTDRRISEDALDHLADEEDALPLAYAYEHASDLLADAGFDEHTGIDTVLDPRHENTMFLAGCLMMESDDEL